MRRTYLDLALLVVILVRDVHSGLAARDRWAKPRIDSMLARTYRTELRREARLGPNFNGHYRILSWGCGSACVYWSVIDLANGAVWISPMETSALPRIDDAGDPHWIDATVDAPTIRTYSIVDDDAKCPRGKYLENTFIWTGKAPEPSTTRCVAWAN